MTITLSNFLTDEQILEAQKLRKAFPICEKIIRPNIVEINKKLGQENDPMFLAYACEHIFNQVEERTKK